MTTNIEKSLDKSLAKKEDIENIKTLNHRLNNILGFSASSINRLKIADAKVIEKRWANMRDVIVVTGKCRIDKEIELLKKRKEILEKVSRDVYTDVVRQLFEVDYYYKTIYDIVYDSNEYSEKDKNTALENGDSMIRLLKDIINKLEAIKFELQKK